MAIVAIFTPPHMDAAQFDEIIRRLDAAGASAPPGRLHHTCYGELGHLKVMDVWDSPESFQRFGGTLMPILHEMQVEVGQPTVLPVHLLVPQP